MKLLLAILLFVPAIFADEKESISTRSTEAKGVLVCGNKTAEGVVVRLVKAKSEDIGKVIGTTKTNKDGEFKIEGNTHNFEGTEANIDPYLCIYHKCDRKADDPYRRFIVRYPREFVTIGRIPRRTYHLGTLNLQLQYPKEDTKKVIEGL